MGVAVDRDVFGFDELSRAFNRLEAKYPNEADRLLMAQGKAVTQRVKQLTPTGPRPKRSNGRPIILKNKWQLKRVKEYKDGKVKVVRIQSAAPHAHLIERGHKIVARGTRGNSNKGGSPIGDVEGNKMLEQAIQEVQRKIGGAYQRLLEELTREIRVD